MAAQSAVIQMNNLTKVYKSGRKETRALENLTMDVKPGEIFGYLGPNGAGKTTTIRLLLDLIRPTAGASKIFGKDAQAHSVELHRRIGFLPGELNLWRNRTAKQVVNYMANVRGDANKIMKEANVLSERLKFDMSKRIRDYSTGNKRKLGLVLALMHSPDLLILDEPSSGLDPLMQQEFNHLMQEARDNGKTVFLSSHVLGEVQAICDRVGILRDGKLQAVDNIEKFTNVEFRWVEMHFRDAVPQAWLPRLQQLESVSEVTTHNSTGLKLKLHGDFDPVIRAVSDGYIQTISVREPSLEEIFLTFYGEKETM